MSLNSSANVTLTSTTSKPLLRGFTPVVLSTNASLLSFPLGVDTTGPPSFTINNSARSVSFGGAVNQQAMDVTAVGDISVSSSPVTIALDALTMNAGNNLNIAAGANIQVEFPSTSDLTLQAGNDILIGDGLFIQGSGPVFLIAGNNLTVSGTTGEIRTLLTDDVTFVTDNNNPNPPDFGTGKFTFPSGYTLCTNLCVGGPGKVLLFTALPVESTFPTIINTASYTPGTFGEAQYNPGTNELAGFWYITQPPPDPPLFQIMYKVEGVVDPAVVQTVEVAVIETVSNPTQISQVTEGNLSPPSTPDPKTPYRTPPVAVQAL